MTLYHGTQHDYDGMPIAPRCGWVWWTAESARAVEYGARIIERTAEGLRILDVSDARDGAEFVGALADAGVDMDGIRDGMPGPDDDEPPSEPHMLLSGRQGAEIARRVRAAGYDAIRHWEDHYSVGEGEVIAVAA